MVFITDFVHGSVLLVSSVSFESHGDSGGGSSLNHNKICGIKFNRNFSIKRMKYLKIPGDSSPPLAAPGSDVSLRSEIDDTFR